MPTYDYHCTNCDHTEEIFQKITAERLTKCPACGKETFQRGPGGGIGLSFKGTGYYITDYGPQAGSEEKTVPQSKPASSCCPCGKSPGSCDP